MLRVDQERERARRRGWRGPCAHLHVARLTGRRSEDQLLGSSRRALVGATDLDEALIRSDSPGCDGEVVGRVDVRDGPDGERHVSAQVKAVPDRMFELPAGRDRFVGLDRCGGQLHAAIAEGHAIDRHGAAPVILAG